jgi:membrane associated rhomboid family serine protease
MPIRLSLTTLLILLNVAGFGLQQLLGTEFRNQFALWPVHEGSLFRPWQLVTHAFLHGSLYHLMFNMLGLYMIGGRVEELLGPKRYLVYYLVCSVGAAALHLLVDNLRPAGYGYAVGASGALFGVLLAFGAAFPKEKLMLIFLPIPIPAWLFVILYAACELYLGVSQTLPGIGHFAHLGGMLAGIVMMALWWRQVRARATLLSNPPSMKTR